MRLNYGTALLYSYKSHALECSEYYDKIIIIKNKK